MKYLVKLYFFIVFFVASFFMTDLLASPYYEVVFEGIEDSKTTAAIKNASQLLILQEKATASLLALKRRSEGDVSNFIKVMQSRAYYNAKIDYKIDASSEPVKVIFSFDAGPQYPLSSVQIVSTDGDILDIDVGLVVGEPAFAEKILSAEETLLLKLGQMGYPYAAITDRKVVADQKRKEIDVQFIVDQGPISYFGKTSVRGNSEVEEEYIRSKIRWKEGDVYSSEAIERTREDLEDTGLFRMTVISHANDCSKELLSMDIQVIEAKQRTIAAGASFTTQLGFGASGEWEHRNVRGFGERINTSLNLWQKRQEGKVSYLLPDFGFKGQDLIWSACLEREITDGYHETSLKFSGIFEYSINDCLKIGYGGMYQSIFTSHSANNGNFHLFKLPVFVSFGRSNSLLDPTEGYSLHIKTTPSLQLARHVFGYCPTLFTGTYYQPLTEDHRVVFATKATFGSIFGASRRAIPPSELFYAGNENTLRGYSYMTVSPLNKKGKPIGGRSIGVLSFEARLRMTEKLGGVGFYEVGNVYASRIPNPNHKQLQSIGVGLRYRTPVGPLRFDVAFPLNKRKKIDSDYQLYMSIGQSF